MGAVSAGRGRQDAATANSKRSHVEEVDVDRPLAERVDGERRRDRKPVADREVAEGEPGGRQGGRDRSDDSDRAFAAKLRPGLAKGADLAAPTGFGRVVQGRFQQGIALSTVVIRRTRLWLLSWKIVIRLPVPCST